MNSVVNVSARMAIKPVKPEDTFLRLQRVIADNTGHDPEEITLDTDFEDDLGLDMDNDFAALVPAIKREFSDVNISSKAIMNSATVAELVELIDDEQL